MSKVLFVEWCAADALGGTLLLDPITELAYRRILDMIYATEDNLADDDDVLAHSTKAGKQWPEVKKKLIEKHRKIYVENGLIRNSICTIKIAKSRKNIEQKIKAVNSRRDRAKPLEDIEAGSTAVDTDEPTNESTFVPTNQEPNREGLERTKPSPAKAPKKSAEKFYRFEGKVVCLTDPDFDRLHALAGMSLEGWVRWLDAEDEYLATLPEEKRKNWWHFLNAKVKGLNR